MGGRGRVRLIALAWVAVAMAATALVTAPAVGAEWEPTPTPVPPGSERIPFTVETVSRTYQSGVDGAGRPAGYCYDEVLISFDPRYGKPVTGSSAAFPGQGIFFAEHTGGTKARLEYSQPPQYGISWPIGSGMGTGNWSTADFGDRMLYRIEYAWSAKEIGLLVDGGDPNNSECAPSVRAPRLADLRANVEDEVLWTHGPIHPPVDVVLRTPDTVHEVGDEIPVEMTVTNTTPYVATGLSFSPAAGLQVASSHLEIVSAPPSLPTSLQPDQSVTLDWVVRPKVSATSDVSTTVRATLEGVQFTDTASARISVPPEVTVELDTDVTSETKVGDEFHVTATITNLDDVPMRYLDSDPLATRPTSAVSPVSGPLTAAGTDPYFEDLSIAPGASTTLHWTSKAEEAGNVELTAYVSGLDTHLNTRFTISARTSVAIESPGLVISDLRLQPGSIVPGDFGNLRGTVTNNGSVDVTDIDFTLDSNPELRIVPGLLEQLDPSVSPRIAKLEPEQQREFLIPVAMVTDAGDDFGSYTAEVRLAGTATIGGEPTEVAATSETTDALDLSPYWSTILDRVRSNLFDDFVELIEGVNDWGDSSTLGGVSVGGGQGVLNAFQKMGDGILKVNDLLGEVSGDGGQRLTDDGKAIVAAVREYLHTTSAQKMAVDLANLEQNVAVGGVGVFAEWMRDVDRAYTAGDTRKVAELIAEPATEVAIGFGVEKAGAQIFTKLMQQPIVRQTLHALKRAPEPITDGPDVPYDQIVARELQDLKDMPTGVAITGETVARAGLTADEHGWMIEMAREHGIAFFVRPRPETAAKFARLGYNAKPMAIKLKSISEIDHRWLGWEDFADSEGLVVFREPKDPLQAMMDAVDRGELEWGGKEIDDIIERYNLRKAEWKSYEKPFGPDGPTVDPREGILHKLNGDTIGPDGSIVPGEGFTVQRYGKTIRTKVTIDPDGVIRFTHNDQPVYSDIDLLAIAKPDGSAIDPELHRLISQHAGFGIDSQHGDSVLTSDFANWDDATKFAVKYANEHRRGGDPLVIVQPDVTTLGYVDSLDVPASVPGSGYDLYGKITTTYEGAGRR